MIHDTRSSLGEKRRVARVDQIDMRKALSLVVLLAACAPSTDPSDTSSEGASLLHYPSSPDSPAYGRDPITGVSAPMAPLVMTGDVVVHPIYFGGVKDTRRVLLDDFMQSLDGSALASVLTTYEDSTGAHPSGRFDVRPHVVVDAKPSDPTTLEKVNFVDIIEPAEGGESKVDPNGLYVIITGPDFTARVENKARTKVTNFCSACGWHDALTFGSAGKKAHYVFIGDPKFCKDHAAPGARAKCHATNDPSPNDDADGDVMTTRLWHETAEAVTDPEPFAGYTTEIADLCEGSPLSTDDGSFVVPGFVQHDFDYTVKNPAGVDALANIHMGDRDYRVQPVWQHVEGGGCVRRLVLHKPSVGNLRKFPVGDFDNNLAADLLIRSTKSGEVSVSLLGATEDRLPFQNVGSASSTFQIYGIADFDGNAISDILWREMVTGRLSVWRMGSDGSTTVVAESTEIMKTLDVKWAIKAVGDFDGEGHADILFMDMTTNETRVWFNHGHIFSPSHPAAPFTISELDKTDPTPAKSDNLDTIGAGDFDGDGKSDVLWQHFSPNTVRLWTFSGHHITTTFVPSSHWDRILGLGDVNLDGKAEILAVKGTDLVWADGKFGDTIVIAPLPGSEWWYAGSSAVDGWGAALFWRNRHTGGIHRWILQSDGTIHRSEFGTIALQDELIAY